MRKRCACGKWFEPINRGFGARQVRFCSKSCGLHYTRVQRVVTCQRCRLVFLFQGRSCCWYCPVCRKTVQRETQQRYRSKAGRTKHPGVGSGGAQWGSANHQWKGGSFVWTKYTGNYRRRCFRVWGTKCVICGSANRVQVHHLDGDSEHCRQENLVPVCFLCHWKIHFKKKQSPRELLARLFMLWPTGRSKIAEKNGNAAKRIRGEGRL